MNKKREITKVHVNLLNSFENCASTIYKSKFDNMHSFLANQHKLIPSALFLKNSSINFKVINSFINAFKK